ncbi:hypothetical protein OG410_18040 [Streptomyces sp. NBC_00659]|uniref:hypothetical protein n=1 Tax=Streptomyces sp. NBC_00659 TaxID=2903669 RepID=UPI002E2FCCD0|nr:hypothetical protein [Streptomyces sp. NBC_00659]
MNADRKGRKGRDSHPCPRCPADGSQRPPESTAVPDPTYNALVQQGISSNAASSRLRQIKDSETTNRIRQREAHIDGLIRVFRNVAAVAVFAVVTLTVVAYAGMKAGIPPEACIAGGVTSATLLVRAFTKIFDAVRSSLPAAPEDRPSNGEP